MVALSVSPLGARDRVLRLLARFAGRGLGHRLRRDGRLAANDRIPGSALSVLRPRGRVPLAVRRRLRALLGLLRGPHRRLRRLVGLDPLAPRSGLELGGANDLRLRVDTHRGKLRLQPLGVAEHRDHLARTFQISRQSSGQRAQAARGQAHRPLLPARLAAVPIAGRADPHGTAALAKRAHRVVLGQLAIAQHARHAVQRRR